jgi:putative DNA methylase
MASIRKKLIEVSIPLEAINAASAREKSIRHGHPSTLHLWWARRPLAACRAVLFAQLVDDPSAWPERFPTEEAQEAERKRLHDIIKRMVPWEASNDERILNEARFEIARSVAWGLGEEPPDPRNGPEILAYLQEKAPPVYDPFCGGGSIPLEAQRLGLRAYGSDLNPVAVLISKALVEIPPKFAGLPPVNPQAQAELKRGGHWNGKGAQGLAEDVRYYGKWMRDEAEKRIGHLYPKAKLEDGTEATVIAWLWARTVRSPDPAAKGAMVPLLSSYMLSDKDSRRIWVQPIVDGSEDAGYRFKVVEGKPDASQLSELKRGNKAGRSGFTCLLTGAAINFEYIRQEALSNGLGKHLIALLVHDGSKRKYIEAPRNNLTPHEPLSAELYADGLVTTPSHDVDRLPMYGMPRWRDAFSPRQLTSLSIFANLVSEVKASASRSYNDWMQGDRSRAKHFEITNSEDYGRAVATYLGLAIGRAADYWSTIATWDVFPAWHEERSECTLPSSV